MADEIIRVDIEAQDKASRPLDKVADKAEALEKLDPEIEVTADAGKADADLRDVEDTAQRLERADWVVRVRADLDKAKGDAKQLQEQLARLEADGVDIDTSRATKSLDDVTSKAPSSVGALRDVAGGFGNVGGGALDAGESILGLVEVMGDASPKLANFAAELGKAGFIGAGVALGVTLAKKGLDGLLGITEKVTKSMDNLKAATASTGEAFNDYARATRNKQVWDALTGGLQDQLALWRDNKDSLDAFNDVLKESPALAAQLLAEIKKQPDAFGLSAGEVDKAARSLEQYVTAQIKADAGTKLLADEEARLRTEMGLAADESDRAADSVDRVGEAEDRARVKADKLRNAFDRLRGAVSLEQEAANLQNALTTALDTSGQSALEARDDVLTLKQSIIDAGETAGANPIEVQTAVEMVDAGELERATAQAQLWLDRNKLILKFQAQQIQTGAGTAPGFGTGPRMAAPAAPGVTNVTVNMPRGARYDPGVTRQVSRYARRNGGRR